MHLFSSEDERRREKVKVRHCEGNEVEEHIKADRNTNKPLTQQAKEEIQMRYISVCTAIKPW